MYRTLRSAMGHSPRSVVQIRQLDAARTERMHRRRPRGIMADCQFFAPGDAMDRRQFLQTSAAAVAAGTVPVVAADTASKPAGPGFASPADARNAPREKQLYVIALYGGTGIRKPDYLATVDVDP